MFDALVLWMQEHRQAIAALTALSVLLLAATVIATPWVIAQLPTDYFKRKHIETGSLGPLRVALLILRNGFGVLFILIGIVMMVTPGPGLVAMILGLSICEFPGKHDLLMRLAGQPNVFASLNWLRHKANKPAFIHPRHGID